MSLGASSQDHVAADLRATRLWRGASDDTIAAAAGAMRRTRFPAGEKLVRRGRRAERLVVVLRGRVEVRVLGIAGTATVVAECGAGETVGEMSLVTGEAATADVVAVDDVDALEMSAADFTRIVRPDPVLLARFVRILTERLQRAEFALSLAREHEGRFEQLLLDPREAETEFEGKSTAARQVRARAAELGATEGPVLVFGEDGTKRETVARMIHLASARREGPLIVLDCAEITDDGAADRLFGSRSEGIVSRTACYMDVAEGGTILLRKPMLLPRSVQERLTRHLEDAAAQGGFVARGARVVALCGEEGGEPEVDTLLPALLATFGDRRVRTPPLRDRKRDIPELATAMLRDHAERLGRPAREFDGAAVTRLVSYDYRFANDRELAAAVERAVVLADGPTVQAEEIFLGPPPTSQPSGIDLLRLPGLDLRRVLPRLPSVGRVLTGIGFAALLWGCFFAESGPDGNLATFMAWSLGWPLLAFSFFFVGRAACAVCPMGACGSVTAERRASRRTLPPWIKDQGHWIALAGFVVILFLEQATGMHRSPLLTGLLLLGILSAAVVTALVFPRRTWCRHLCPLGGFAGVCATSAMVELRPSIDVCSARCVGHSCFKGTERVPGCPMFNHVMFVDGNRDCVMCMLCVRSCPNDSPRLNVRLPGSELWTGRDARPEVAAAVLAFAGTTLALAVIRSAEHSPGTVLGDGLHGARYAFVALALVLGAGLPLLAGRRAARALERRGDAALAALWRRRVAGFAPLVAAAFVALQAGNLPALPGLRAVVVHSSVGAGASGWANISLLSAVQFGVLSAGLLGTAVVLWQIDRSVKADAEAWGTRWHRDVGLLAAAVGYWGLVLALLLLS